MKNQDKLTSEKKERLWANIFNLSLFFILRPFIIHQFWNAFITDLFNIRELHFMESIGIFFLAIAIFDYSSFQNIVNKYLLGEDSK